MEVAQDVWEIPLLPERTPSEWSGEPVALPLQRVGTAAVGIPVAPYTAQPTAGIVIERIHPSNN
jgi:hypothetical protein